MNAGIAELLRDRIAAFAYVEKIAGLVRPITYQRQGPDGKTVFITIPVGIDVVDPLECSEDTQLALVPNDAYRAIVYFEDRGVTIGERQGRATRVSHLRLVCWVNTAKLNGDNTAGDRMAQDFDGAMNVAPYNSEAFLGIRHRVEGFPAKGPGLFSQYTYPEGVRQYLMWPFDAFAINIATEYMPNPACIVPIDPTDVNCWTPPETRRRRNPNEFTCEELIDPVTGLTEEQLGASCLDCEGGGPCDPATVNINGTEVATPASGGTANLEVVDQNGNPIGSFVSGQWVVTIPEDVPYIARVYADDTEALADVLTVPENDQAIKVASTKRIYQGDGVSTSAQLVAAQEYLLPVVDDPGRGPVLNFETKDYHIQINEV